MKYCLQIVHFILTFSEECMKLHSEIPDAAKNLSVIKTNHKKITCYPTDSINSTDNCKCYIDQTIRIVYCLSRHAFNGNWLLLCLEIWLWKHLIFQTLTIRSSRVQKLKYHKTAQRYRNRKIRVYIFALNLLQAIRVPRLRSMF